MRPVSKSVRAHAVVLRVHGVSIRRPRRVLRAHVAGQGVLPANRSGSEGCSGGGGGGGSGGGASAAAAAAADECDKYGKYDVGEREQLLEVGDDGGDDAGVDGAPRHVGDQPGDQLQQAGERAYEEGEGEVLRPGELMFSPVFYFIFFC